MKRTYIAQAQIGKGSISFVFRSEHRANSKANINDARTCWRIKHGFILKQITNTYLASDCDLPEGQEL